MQLSIKGKQIDLGDALRTHVESSLGSLTGKYFNDAIEGNVFFAREANGFRVDLSLHVARQLQLQTEGQAENAHLAFDRAAEKMAKRLRRYKRRLSDHSRDQPLAAALPAQAYVLAAEPEEVPDDHDEPAQPMVVAEMMTQIDTLTVSQAVMRLDLADLPALMFRNPAHGGLNMVYRRSDGNVGWVDPHGTPQTL